MWGLYTRGTKRLQLALFGAAALLVAGGFTWLTIVRSVEPLALDQGLFACFGRWVPRGWLPYRDLFDSKPPLFLYTWALAWSFGGSAASVWWFEAVWLLATMGLSFAAAARSFGAPKAHPPGPALPGRDVRCCGRWAGLAAAALVFVGLWSPGFGGYWSRAQAEELMALPMVGAAWLALRALRRERLALWAGALTGVVGLYKIPGMAVAAAWAGLWLIELPWREAARRVGWLAAGITAPWLLAVAWFAVHGAAGEFFTATIVYHRHNAAFIAPPWGSVLGGLARMLARELPGTMLCAAAGIALLWARRERAQAVWLLLWIVATIAAVALQRQLAGYQVMLVVPGLAVAAGAGLAEIARLVARTRVGGVAPAAVAALAVIVSAWQVDAWQQAYGRDASMRLGRISRAEYLRRFEAGLFSPATEGEAARYLRANSGPDDRILVWGLSPGIYALADRRPATRFPFHKLLLTDAPLSRMIPGLAERRAELMRGLRDDPPLYILVGTRDRNPFEPDDSFTGMMKFAELARFVEDGYREETKIGRFVVLRRRR